MVRIDFGVLSFDGEKLMKIPKIKKDEQWKHYPGDNPENCKRIQLIHLFS